MCSSDLKGQPLLLPTQNTVLRRSVEMWLERQDFDAVVSAEIEDSALLKLLAAEGLGIAPVASIVLRDLQVRYGLYPIGSLDGATMQFYAISVERRVTHPAVKAISESARSQLFRV